MVLPVLAWPRRWLEKPVSSSAFSMFPNASSPSAWLLRLFWGSWWPSTDWSETESQQGDRRSCGLEVCKRCAQASELNWTRTAPVSCHHSPPLRTGCARDLVRELDVRCSTPPASSWCGAGTRMARKVARKARGAICGFLVSQGPFMALAAPEAFLEILVATTWPAQCSLILAGRLLVLQKPSVPFPRVRPGHGLYLEIGHPLPAISQAVRHFALHVAPLGSALDFDRVLLLVRQAT